MKYKLKDKVIENFLKAKGFDEEKIYSAIKMVFEESAGFELCEFRSKKGEYPCWQIGVSMEDVEMKREHTSGDWKPYPETKPPKGAPGCYLVTLASGRVTVKFWSDLFQMWDVREREGSVTAFMELPEAYKSKVKDMHPDAIYARKYAGEEE